MGDVGQVAAASAAEESIGEVAMGAAPKMATAAEPAAEAAREVKEAPEGVQVALMSGETIACSAATETTSAGELCLMLQERRLPAEGSVYRLLRGDEVMQDGDVLGTGRAFSAVVKRDLLKTVAGSWRTMSGDGYFIGLTVAADGSYTCNQGRVTDGLVRVLSDPPAGKLNLRRTIRGANDHIFDVSEDGRTMRGHCPQSGVRWVLEKDVEEVAAASTAEGSTGEAAMGAAADMAASAEPATDAAVEAEEAPEGVQVALMSGETIAFSEATETTSAGELCLMLQERRPPVEGSVYRLLKGNEIMQDNDALGTERAFSAVVKRDLVKTVAGSWRTISGDRYFIGLAIAADGSYTCNQGRVTDGLVRALSDPPAGKLNLRRTVRGANDHIFDVSENGRTMRGHCPQSGVRWVLEKTE